MTQDNTELLPCPRCCDAPTWGYLSFPNGHGGMIRHNAIRCLRCHYWFYVDGEKTSTAEIWNTRPTQGHDALVEVVAFLRHEANIGAEWGNEAEKGSTRRAAYGGGSLALDRAADVIERGEHRGFDVRCIGCNKGIGHLAYAVDDNGETGCPSCFTEDGKGVCFFPNTLTNLATPQAEAAPDDRRFAEAFALNLNVVQGYGDCPIGDIPKEAIEQALSVATALRARPSGDGKGE